MERLQGQIFYLSTSNSIIQAMVVCNQSTGKCTLQGVYTLSNAVSTGINPSTALAASLRNASDGYRVFYHDNTGETRMLRYSGPKNITWGESRPVITAENQVSGAVATEAGVNQTTYSIDGSGNVIPATLDHDEHWVSSRFARSRNQCL